MRFGGFSGFEMGFRSAADARFEIVLERGPLRQPASRRLGSAGVGARPKWQLFETGTVRFVPVVTGDWVRNGNNMAVELRRAWCLPFKRTVVIEDEREISAHIVLFSDIHEVIRGEAPRRLCTLRRFLLPIGRCCLLTPVQMSEKRSINCVFLGEM